MLNVSYDITNMEDIVWVARHMREADEQEVRASHDHSPREALEYAVQHSQEVYTAFIDDEPVAIFGVAGGSVMTPFVSPWMLGSKKLEQNKKILLRASRDVIETFKKEYYRMENFVDVRNKLSIRWLKWLGFSIKDPEPYGPFDMEFHRFVWERQDV